LTPAILIERVAARLEGRVSFPRRLATPGLPFFVVRKREDLQGLICASLSMNWPAKSSSCHASQSAGLLSLNGLGCSPAATAFGFTDSLGSTVAGRKPMDRFAVGTRFIVLRTERHPELAAVIMAHFTTSTGVIGSLFWPTRSAATDSSAWRILTPGPRGFRLCHSRIWKTYASESDGLSRAGAIQL